MTTMPQQCLNIVRGLKALRRFLHPHCEGSSTGNVRVCGFCSAHRPPLSLPSTGVYCITREGEARIQFHKFTRKLHFGSSQPIPSLPATTQTYTNTGKRQSIMLVPGAWMPQFSYAARLQLYALYFQAPAATASSLHAFLLHSHCRLCGATSLLKAAFNLLAIFSFEFSLSKSELLSFELVQPA
jgi:hypothetical protein